MIRRADQSEDNLYLRNQMLEAKNFIKSIDERHKTLLKVASCIVEHQKLFGNRPRSDEAPSSSRRGRRSRVA